jgi:oligoendopeptidase F
MLANADFKFKPARDSEGKNVNLTQSTYNAIMGGTYRKARRTAWENYTDK